MKRRCFCSKLKAFKYYGGRGITVCERWMSFKNFLFDMGLKPSQNHSLDRINNDGNYEPSNCRWATWIEQASNRRNSVKHSAFGKNMTASEWSAELGIPVKRIFRESRLGFSIEWISKNKPLPKRNLNAYLMDCKNWNWKLKNTELSKLHGVCLGTMVTLRKKFRPKKKIVFSKTFRKKVLAMCASSGIVALARVSGVITV